ncbi:MAG: hypothetical protein AABX11_01095 [Nanoarchaeota archaeon]
MKRKTQQIIGAGLVIGGVITCGEFFRELLASNNLEYDTLRRDRIQILDQRYPERRKYLEEVCRVEFLPKEEIIDNLRRDRDFQSRYLIAREYVQKLDNDADLKKLSKKEIDLARKYSPLANHTYGPLVYILGMLGVVVGGGMVITSNTELQKKLETLK